MDFKSLKKNLITKDGEQRINISEPSLVLDGQIIPTKVHRVYEHEEMRPDLISIAYYNSPSHADAILKFNGISNPFSIKEGDWLYIPPITEINKSFIALEETENKPREVFIDKNKMSEQDKKRVEYLKNLRANSKSSQNLAPNMMKTGESGITQNGDGTMTLGPNIGGNSSSSTDINMDGISVTNNSGIFGFTGGIPNINFNFSGFSAINLDLRNLGLGVSGQVNNSPIGSHVRKLNFGPFRYIGEFKDDAEALSSKPNENPISKWIYRVSDTKKLRKWSLLGERPIQSINLNKTLADNNLTPGFRDFHSNQLDTEFEASESYILWYDPKFAFWRIRDEDNPFDECAEIKAKSNIVFTDKDGNTITLNGAALDNIEQNLQNTELLKDCMKRGLQKTLDTNPDLVGYSASNDLFQISAQNIDYSVQEEDLTDEMVASFCNPDRGL